MTIAVGDTLPAATFRTMGENGPTEITTEALTKGRRIVLFGVPGAFTPTCNNSHLPGFLTHRDEILAKGIDEIAVVAVNDVFVMDAWSKQSDAKGKILFLADGSANFTRAVGLDVDASGFGMGIRSKRFSMVVDDGVVRTLNIEETPRSAEASGAAALLTLL